MHALTGVIRNGRVELNQPIELPDGTPVDVTVELQNRAAKPGHRDESYRDFVLSIAGSFGDEPFERPEQGEFENREDW